MTICEAKNKWLDDPGKKTPWDQREKRNAVLLVESICISAERDRMKTVDELLQTPYWIIDILPKQVPANSPGKYFSVEKYLRETQMKAIKQQHIQVILKLYCYESLTLVHEDEEIVNPSPAQIAEMINTRYVNILVRESMILSEPDDTHMTLFNPDDELLTLVCSLASAEGMFIWKPQFTPNDPMGH